MVHPEPPRLLPQPQQQQPRSPPITPATTSDPVPYILSAVSCGPNPSGSASWLNPPHESSAQILEQLRSSGARRSSIRSNTACCRSSSHGSVKSSTDNVLSPPPRVVSASDDTVYVDAALAAAVNLQNPPPTTVEPNSSSEDDEEDRQQQDSADLPPVESECYYEDANDFATFSSIAATEGGDGIGTPPRKGIAMRRKKNPKSPSLAWEKLALSLRHSDTKPSRGWLESWLGCGGAAADGTNNNILQVLLEEARKSGRYVQFQPSMEVAISSCADPETGEAVKVILSVLGLRDDFLITHLEIDSKAVFPRPKSEQNHTTEPIFAPNRAPVLGKCDAVARWEEGVIAIYWLPSDAMDPLSDQTIPTYQGKPLLDWAKPVPRVSQYLSALKQVMAAVQHPACKTFSYRRLEFLRDKFNLHKMFNSTAELSETKSNKHRDFYNVRKVDTHVHHSACMHQKHLLRFIRKKFKTEPNEIVARSSEGHPVTLAEIFEKEVGVHARDASLDLLNVHALGSCFQRFDIFNSKYNPFGQALLREVFLKTDNILGGRYLAELTQEVEHDLMDGKYQYVEWRLSIYGKRRDEWSRLARWITKHNLSCQQVRWMIQVPRLFHVYRRLGIISSFGELLRNVFEPLFEAIADPPSHPEIFHMLLQLNGWDSVDDESVVSKYTSEGGALPLPDDWVEPSNPPYSYWMYYMYANIRRLNEFLVARGLRHLPFRPHCGEAGSVSHLASAFLLADGINHGIMLKKAPVLQYLFYLRQIGMALSPLSNNALFHDISKNPFAHFFATGLNVSLSTDDPMMFHFTSEPLLEEYSCCAHTWKLSPVDLCELARNSVLQSHFEPQLKRHWVGDSYTLRGAAGNDILKTNVSNLRVQFREDTLSDELKYLRDVVRIQDFVEDLTRAREKINVPKITLTKMDTV